MYTVQYGMTRNTEQVSTH